MSSATLLSLSESVQNNTDGNVYSRRPPCDRWGATRTGIREPRDVPGVGLRDTCSLLVVAIGVKLVGGTTLSLL